MLLTGRGDDFANASDCRRVDDRHGGSVGGSRNCGGSDKRSSDQCASFGKHFGSPDRCEIGCDGRYYLKTSQLNRGVTERAEERRVGQECVRTCISRWWAIHEKK